MKIRLGHARLYRIEMQTRMPFRYGIACVTRLPHLFLRLPVLIDGQEYTGIAADHLAPKWFTKNPETSFEADTEEMLRVIRQAVVFAEGGEGESVFEVWRALYDAQADWGARENLAPLLTNFGVSLVERALIDAVCRAAGRRPFAALLRDNTLGIRLGDIHPALASSSPADLLPQSAPLPRLTARHTVGLSDPLTEQEITEQDRVRDGLPQSLEAAIRAYGLRHFKIKISADDPAKAVSRLEDILTVIADHAAAPDWAFSLDGNESYRTLAAFRAFWDAAARSSRIVPHLGARRLLFVEQPLHRDIALSPEVGAAFAGWPDRPPIIIDESDAALTSLPTALSLGYAGTSHKNCKGVFKGIANACLLEHRRRTLPDTPTLLSGEDLCTVGPVSLLQDMAVQAALGIESVERNGHHYFAGLSAFPQAVQKQVREGHPDLYETAPPPGWPTLAIRDGRLNLGSVNAAPFGCHFDLDPALYFEEA